MLPNEDFGTLNKRTVVTPHAWSTFQGCEYRIWATILWKVLRKYAPQSAFGEHQGRASRNAQSFVLPSKIGIYDVHQVLHALEKCFPLSETLWNVCFVRFWSQADSLVTVFVWSLLKVHACPICEFIFKLMIRWRCHLVGLRNPYVIDTIVVMESKDSVQMQWPERNQLCFVFMAHFNATRLF